MRLTKRSVVCILAGGSSDRMGGADKAALQLGGRRLIDIVIERLKPQAGIVVIAGDADRATGLPLTHDKEGAVRGPAAGVWGAYDWVKDASPKTEGFYTVPVDGPFVPDDLIEQLYNENGCAIASDGVRDHPTYAYWDMDILLKGLEKLAAEKKSALHALADFCHARRVLFPAASLANINTPEDLAEAEKAIR